MIRFERYFIDRHSSRISSDCCNMSNNLLLTRHVFLERRWPRSPFGISVMVRACRVSNEKSLRFRIIVAPRICLNMSGGLLFNRRRIEAIKPPQ